MNHGNYGRLKFNEEELVVKEAIDKGVDVPFIMKNELLAEEADVIATRFGLRVVGEQQPIITQTEAARRHNMPYGSYLKLYTPGVRALCRALKIREKKAEELGK